MIPKFHFVSVFPEVIEKYLGMSLFKKALERDLLQFQTWNPRDFSQDRHQSVDEKPFGGGEGMVMKAEPLAQCMNTLLAQVRDRQRVRTIHLSPQGKVLDQETAQKLLRDYSEFVLISSRYSGIDQRFINEYVDEEISIGNYVLAGGELASLVLCETMARFIPGFIGDAESALNDSFSLPGLESPLFTQPREWRGSSVPSILLSGHHGNIQKWKKMIEILVTQKKRPELLSRFSKEEIQEANLFDRQLESSDKKALGLEENQ